MTIGDFFENTLGAKLHNSRWSWGAFNPTTNQLFLRVWRHELETVAGVERIRVLRTDWDRTSDGFPEREKHVISLRNGAEGYGVLCTAKDPRASGSRQIAQFDHESLLKFGKLIDDGNGVYAQIVDRIPVGNLARRPTAHSSLLPDLKLMLATEREALAKARIGQGPFRTQVLDMWGRRCCVTGSTTLDAIRASHIKPWRDSNDDERLDPNNGLPLVATLDALFDAGLIAFAPDDTLLTSSWLDSTEKTRLGLSQLRLIKKPKKKTAEYLAYHLKKSLCLSTQPAPPSSD